MTTMAEHALDYLRRGWSVIPIRPGTKYPACRKWAPYQARHPSEATVCGWFNGDEQRGVAVILGPVSGGLVGRDFDEMAAYERWAEQHGDLAARLPTVATARGRHVYARGDPAEVEQVCPSAYLNLGDGELRWAGSYLVLPPSKHPSGAVYEWLIRPGECVPRIVLAQSGLAESWAPPGGGTPPTPRKRGLATQRTQTTQEIGGGVALRAPPTTELSDPAGRFVRATLPDGPGQRHRLIFECCRLLKGDPATADHTRDQLRVVAREWHRLALPTIRTKEWEESWLDFTDAWERVELPSDGDSMFLILQEAKRDIPAVAEQYDAQWVRELVALCLALQRRYGDGPFPLDCYTVGRLFHVHKTTAARRMRMLVSDSVLRVEKPADHLEHRATEYRYVADELPIGADPPVTPSIPLSEETRIAAVQERAEGNHEELNHDINDNAA